MCENLLDMRVCVCNLQDLVYKIFFIKMLSYHGRYQIKLKNHHFGIIVQSLTCASLSFSQLPVSLSHTFHIKLREN